MLVRSLRGQTGHAWDLSNTIETFVREKARTDSLTDHRNGPGHSVFKILPSFSRLPVETPAPLFLWASVSARCS